MLGVVNRGTRPPLLHAVSKVDDGRGGSPLAWPGVNGGRSSPNLPLAEACAMHSSTYEGSLRKNQSLALVVISSAVIRFSTPNLPRMPTVSSQDFMQRALSPQGSLTLSAMAQHLFANRFLTRREKEFTGILSKKRAKRQFGATGVDSSRRCRAECAFNSRYVRRLVGG